MCIEPGTVVLEAFYCRRAQVRIRHATNAFGSAVYLSPAPAMANDAIHTGASATAIILFAIVIGSTLLLTYFAARRNRSRGDFYVAGGSISGGQNGLAIAGDFISASTILGIPAMVLAGNYEAIVYVISTIVGLVLTLLFIVEPLRKLGRFSVAEVVASRYGGRSIRALTAAISLIISILYLLAQMVAAGGLIQLLLGISYRYGLAVVAALMMVYVAFGGMIAATWIQICKAVIMIAGVAILTIVVLHHANFDLPGLYSMAASNLRIEPQTPLKSVSLFSVFSVGAALAFGIPGLPHLLVRVLTVPDVVQARRSMLIALFINCFVAAVVLLVLSYGTLAFVLHRPDLLDSAGKLTGGANMAVIHLARITGGEVLFGFVAAVLFATILAVVSGLVVVSAGAVAHDLYANIFGRGKVSEESEVRAFRLSACGITAATVMLAIAFENRNVTFLVGLAFAVAASASFPLLILSIYWRGMTKRGALLGSAMGLVSSVGLIALSPTVWVDVLHHSEPIFSSPYPTLISMPLAFLTAVVFSFFDRKDPRLMYQRKAYEIT